MTRDPFKVDGPAMVSVSGGRTSAYMLRRVLDAHGGTLPADVHPVFADTGKERPETYEFVRELAVRWGVHVEWVNRPGYFDQLIAERRYLPNPVARFCTSELKIVPMRAFMAGRYETWTEVVGIRADEPRRVSKMRAKDGADGIAVCVPLAETGVTRATVMEFWAAQAFDLRLRPWESNCDLCFLKGQAIRRRIMRDRPELADWWVAKEAQIGGRFRYDAPPYASILRTVQAQPEMTFTAPDVEPDNIADCVCNEGEPE